MADFKHGDVRVLVATDIAARGLDIEQLPHVVNFELPNVSEDYVHRIGRTGRAERRGIAVSLVCIDEWGYLKDIERLLKHPIPQEIIEGYEPDPSIKAEPILRGGNNSSPRQGRNYMPGERWSTAHGPNPAAGRRHGSADGRKRAQEGPRKQESSSRDDAVRGSRDIPERRVVKTRRTSQIFGIPKHERPSDR